MIQLRGVDDKEEVLLDPMTQVQLIDGLQYVATKQVVNIGMPRQLRDMRAFDIVQVDTGCDDDAQPRIMAILPKRTKGIAAFIASMALMLCAVGCTGTTYQYSYTCYGQGCAPMPAFARVGYAQTMPQQARVVYVNRPMEVQVRRDGSSFVRGAAQPQRRR